MTALRDITLKACDQKVFIDVGHSDHGTYKATNDAAVSVNVSPETHHLLHAEVEEAIIGFQDSFLDQEERVESQLESMVDQAHQVLGVDDLIGQEDKLALFLHELAIRLSCLFTPSEVPGEVTLGV